MKPLRLCRGAFKAPLLGQTRSRMASDRSCLLHCTVLSAIMARTFPTSLVSVLLYGFRV